jgi:predicted RND superfamily exporter protein
VFNLFSVVSALLTDLLRSFGAAFIAITVMMVMVLRDIKLGLIAMVPNLLPIVAVMGFMGYVGISIDISTLLIGSIAIGIAVDDTIHFLYQFKAHYRAHGDVDAAIGHAFAHTGRAMIMTSVILVAGFCVYMAATTYNLQRFGKLVGLTVVLALLIDLIFSPALLRTIYRSRPKQEGTEKGEVDDARYAHA